MQRLWHLLRNLPEYTIGIFVILVSLVVFIQIVFRYFLNFSLGWSDELARILFIWISLLGATVCVKRGQHFSFSVLAAWLGKRSNHILHAVATLLVIGFCLFSPGMAIRAFFFLSGKISSSWKFRGPGPSRQSRSRGP